LAGALNCGFHLARLASSTYHNITQIVDGLAAERTLDFGYDAVGRLNRVTLAEGSTAPVKRTDYLFDLNGNRTELLTRPLASDPDSAATVQSYQTAEASNRLEAITGPGGTRSFTYDARGNLTSETRPGGVTVSAGYDGYGRLTSYARTGEDSLSHSYNGMDDRVTTTSGTDTRRFTYAPDGRVLGEYGSGPQDVKAEFIWLNPQVGDGSGPFGGDDGLGGYMPLAVAVGGC
jgi:YD repeat-containing protein